MGYQVGDKAGPKIAQLVAQYVAAVRTRTAPYEARIHAHATQQVIDRAGAEIAALYRPLIALLTDDELAAMHPALADYLASATSGRHQWQAVAGAVGGLAQGVLGQTIGNALAPIAYRINESGPYLVADPSIQAAAWAAGIKDTNSAETAGQWQGLRAGELDVMRQLAESVPSPAQLGDMVNRGLISEGQAASWVVRNAIPAQLRGAALALREALLPPDLAALAVLRGVISHAEGEAIAAKSGVPAKDFAIMVADTGEPLGLEQLLEARRRGFIGDAELRHGILQSRVRDEWIPTAEKLAYSPASTADAVQAVVQGHLTQAQGETIATQNGLEPGNFPWMYETAGEPLSRTELEQLYNRGLISEATVKQGLRESRLKNKYVDDAFDLHVRLPEPRQIVSALTHGAVSKADAMKLLREYGFTEQSATILIAEGTNARAATHHGLTLAEIRQLYSDKLSSTAEVDGWLKALGYDDADINRLLKLWDFLTAAALTRQAVGVVRAKYVARHITPEQVVLELDALGIAPAARDQYLHVWGLERLATVRTLTEAQIIKAYTKQLPGTDEQWAMARLQAIGYDAADAQLLLLGA